jgi:hypothetical protein
MNEDEEEEQRERHVAAVSAPQWDTFAKPGDKVRPRHSSLLSVQEEIGLNDGMEERKEELRLIALPSSFLFVSRSGLFDFPATSIMIPVPSIQTPTLSHRRTPTSSTRTTRPSLVRTRSRDEKLRRSSARSSRPSVGDG